MKKNLSYPLKCRKIWYRAFKSFCLGITMFLCLGSYSLYGQNTSIRVDNATLEQVLKEIQKNSDFQVFYNSRTAQSIKGITLTLTDTPITEILNQALKGTDLDYAITGTTIVIRTRPDEQKKYITIKGNVKDQHNSPLPGASVIVKGTTLGVSTDVDGNFTFQVPADATVVTVSFIGYRTKEIPLLHTESPQTYNIVLEEDAQEINEVVVTGYQTIAKERSTGAFSKISRDQLELRRQNNLKDMLEGQIVGYVDGHIRGVSTMNAISQPLVVIDGFPVENTSMNRNSETTDNMPDLNPEDIESVTVLKDAAAASIYGARAANGVIVITTKRAQKGKTEIQLSATLTVNPYSFYTKNLTNAADVIDMERQWAEQTLTSKDIAIQKANELRNDGAYPSQGINALLDLYTGVTKESEANVLLGNLASLNYQYYEQTRKYTKQNPFYQQYNIRIGKTSDRNSFNASATYWRNRSEDINSYDDKVSINLTDNINITKWLSADFGIFLKYAKETTQNYKTTSSPGFSYQPYDALVNPDGSDVTVVDQNTQEVRQQIAQYGLYDETITPMQEIGYNLGHNKNFNSRAYAKLKIDFTPWLNYTIMYQHENTFDRYHALQEKESYSTRSTINRYTSLSASNSLVYNIPEGDIYYSRDYNTTAFNFRHQLNLDKTFADKHNLVWIIGNETRDNKMEYSDNTLYGYDESLLTWTNIDAKTLASGVSGILGRATLSSSDITTKKELINRFVSVYSNMNYTYDYRYVLSGSIRWDRSNLWGTNIKNQNKPLWSVGASWLISREAFFNAENIDMLKLRGSYGIGGNIGRNTAPYLVAMYWTDYLIGDLCGMVKTPPNEDIRWEKTKTLNIGVDFSVFNSRLTGTVDYYNKKSVDLLANINGSPTQGFGYSDLTTNNGGMTNKGLELTLRGDILRAANGFRWNATVLYAYNKNRVTDIHIKATSYNMQINFPTNYPTLNRPYNGIYAYKWAGLNEAGDPQVYNAAGEIVSTAVEDVDAINYCGTTVPVHAGTFTNIFSYKNFEVSAMLLFQAGHKLRASNIPAINMTGGRISVTSKDITKRWRNPGDEAITDVPRLLFSDDTENYNSYRSTLYRYSDKFVYNASNIKLRNISLSYRLPEKLCQSILVKSMKLQFNIENVATWAFDKKAHYDLGGKIKPNYVCSINVNF